MNDGAMQPCFNEQRINVWRHPSITRYNVLHHEPCSVSQCRSVIREGALPLTVDIVAAQGASNMCSVSIVRVALSVTIVNRCVQENNLSMFWTILADQFTSVLAAAPHRTCDRRVSEARMVSVESRVCSSNNHASPVESERPCCVSGKTSRLHERRRLSVSCLGFKHRLDP